MEDRDFLLKVAHEMGVTVRSLAEISGLSPQRVHQITLEQSEPLSRRLRNALSHLVLSVEPGSESLVIRSTGVDRQAILSRGQARLLVPRGPTFKTLEELFQWIHKQGWPVERFTRGRRTRPNAGIAKPRTMH
jgi:hypothetical protein